jgi:hypothetical protein
MRIVPDLTQAASIQHPDIEALMNRQALWKTIVVTRNVNIPMSNLNHRHAVLPLTVREMLVDSAPPNNPDNKTFLACARAPAGMKVDCLKRDEKQAKEITENLVSHMRHHVECECQFPDAASEPDKTE